MCSFRPLTSTHPPMYIHSVPHVPTCMYGHQLCRTGTQDGGVLGAQACFWVLCLLSSHEFKSCYSPTGLPCPHYKPFPSCSFSLPSFLSLGHSRSHDFLHAGIFLCWYWPEGEGKGTTFIKWMSQAFLIHDFISSPRQS